MCFNDFGEDFYQEKDYQEEIENLEDAIRESVKKEILDKMEKLVKENNGLQEIKKNFDKIKRDYDCKKTKCDIAISNAKKEARRTRLKELMEENKLIKWSIARCYGYKKKCDKCDSGRCITVTLPSGRTANDICSCYETEMYYYIKPHVLYTLSDNYNRGEVIAHYEAIEGETSTYFRFYEGGLSICNSEMRKKIEEWKKNPEQEQALTKLLFSSEKEAQKICDELNAKREHKDWVYNIKGEKIEEVQKRE